MSKYRVSYYKTTNYTATVEATSAEEAQELVEYGDYFVEEFATSEGYDVDDVEEVQS